MVNLKKRTDLKESCQEGQRPDYALENGKNKNDLEKENPKMIKSQFLIPKMIKCHI